MNPRDEIRIVEAPPLATYRTLPPVGRLHGRERYILELARRYGLDGKNGPNPTVDGQFFDALQTLVLPTTFYQERHLPSRETVYVHLAVWVLEGKPLPRPLTHFLP
jgi:hypothetical protein